MEGPIFIIGRQHSGNTMLARCLGQSPEVYSATGEGTFFEHRDRLARKPSSSRAAAILRRAEGSGSEVPAGAHAELKRHMRLAGEGSGPAPGEDEPTPGAGEPTPRAGEPTPREGDPTPGEMYARCMGWIARENGASRWVQKATSYVFYVEDILECFPEARLLFLARNPLDLAASMKRRGVWRAVARMAYGWNKGVRLARRLAQKHPNNLAVIRYEDFVRAPEEEMRSICSFCGLTFYEETLRIPHVNRSESPYNQSSGDTGINASRVGYYDEILTPAEAGAVGALVDGRLIEDIYPELSGEAPLSLTGASYAAALAAGAALTTGGQHLRALLSEPRHALERVKRRLMA
ncbi:sulfotransferase family protein [Salinibacter sp.]|uniref:sulfotransferase family protein n=1 Tax=Salinibacter sp. TaxID=2065818 RepID=UPI0021E7BA7B|nr:sulfotransferase [Salinibacter sp.]